MTNAIDWCQVVFYVLIMIIMLAIPLFIAIKLVTRSQKRDKYLWDQYKNQIEYAKGFIRADRTLNDLITPRNDNKTFHFVVKYVDQKGEHEVNLKPGDPDMQLIIQKLIDCPQEKVVKDEHIMKTKILAVNNNTVTYTSGGISIGGALIGGILAGDVGALLGGLTGSRTSQTKNGENIFTFLVCYDDRTPETEQVRESSKRFKFLITKLET